MSRGSFDPWRTRISLLIDVQDPQNHQAWTAFHGRYAPMIGGWCRQWFPRETEDMVQEVMLLLASRLRTFHYDPGKSFRGYLKTVTHRLMADLKERDNRRRFVNGDGLVEEAEAAIDLTDRLKAEFDLELLEKAKENVRSRVEPKTWIAYVETAENLRKGADVARELGMTVGAVHQAKYNVLTMLREEVKFLEHTSAREVMS
jgi:RNA polymerase sigma-70 factor (ECF subfamily)